MKNSFIVLSNPAAVEKASRLFYDRLPNERKPRTMTKTRKDCRAVRYADQMCCGRCGLTWDTNDPEPPACRKVAVIK